MKSLLKCPTNLFQMIEQIITEKPQLLQIGDWHTLPNGREAFTEEQILEEDTAHCLAGFVVALTANAAKAERLRIDVDEYANEILVNSGRMPIPLAIYKEDEETLRRIIKRRAQDERINALKYQTAALSSN